MILVSITRYIYSSNIVFSSQNYAAGYSGSSHCERKIKIKVIIMGNLKKNLLKPRMIMQQSLIWVSIVI
jgi:hypothetical protein